MACPLGRMQNCTPKCKCLGGPCHSTAYDCSNPCFSDEQFDEESCECTLAECNDCGTYVIEYTVSQLRTNREYCSSGEPINDVLFPLSEVTRTYTSCGLRVVIEGGEFVSPCCEEGQDPEGVLVPLLTIYTKDTPGGSWEENVLASSQNICQLVAKQTDTFTVTVESVTFNGQPVASKCIGSL